MLETQDLGGRPSELVSSNNEGDFARKFAFGLVPVHYLSTEYFGHRLGTECSYIQWTKIAPLNRHPRLASTRAKWFQFEKQRQHVAIIMVQPLAPRSTTYNETLSLYCRTIGCIIDTAHSQ